MPWKTLQSRPLDPDALPDNLQGIALVCGYNNLLAIDFDDPDAYRKWYSGVLAFVERVIPFLHIHVTPSGGYHVLFRCADSSLYNTTTLAKINGKYVAELKSWGACIVIPPTENYRPVESTPVTSLEMLDNETVDSILSIARMLDDGENLPENDTLYRNISDENVDVLKILTAHGWTVLQTDNRGRTFLRRPGSKARHPHATYGLGSGGKLFYVFSTMAFPFTPGYYTPSQVQNLLEEQTGERRNKKTVAHTERKWNPIVPLMRYSPVPFPDSILPEPYRTYVLSLSKNVQVPVDIPAMLLFSVTSAIAAHRLSVAFTEDYVEPANLYIVIVSESGTRKSAVYSHMLAPVDMWTRASRESRKHRNAALRCYADKLRNRVQHAASVDEMTDLYAELEQTERRIQNHDVYLDDTTPEALVVHILRNNNHHAIISPEGGCFGNITGRYTADPNIDVFLKSYGREPLRISRKTADSDYWIYSPCLTLGIAIQPDALKRLGRSDAQLDERGFLSRILYSVPPSLIGTRKLFASSTVEGKAEYRQEIFDMLDDDEEITFTLSDSARDMFVAYANEIERKLNGILYPVQKWACKLHGNLLRVAGILAYLHRKKEINNDIMLGAMRFAEYAIAHATVANMMIKYDDELIDASRILNWILEQPAQEFHVTNLFLHNQHIAGSRTCLRRLLDILAERGYVAYDGTERIILNPSAREKSG